MFCTADVFQCPDGSYVSRDPSNGCAFGPCCCDQADFQTCFVGEAVCCYDGTWSCPNGDTGIYLCNGEETKGPFSKACQEGVACTDDVFDCPDGSSVTRDPNNNCEFLPCCCDPALQPGIEGGIVCRGEGIACCPDGNWACSIGDGRTFPCGPDAAFTTGPFGVACKP